MHEKSSSSDTIEWTSIIPNDVDVYTVLPEDQARRARITVCIGSQQGCYTWRAVESIEEVPALIAEYVPQARWIESPEEFYALQRQRWADTVNRRYNEEWWRDHGMLPRW